MYFLIRRCLFLRLSFDYFSLSFSLWFFTFSLLFVSFRFVWLIFRWFMFMLKWFENSFVFINRLNIENFKYFTNFEYGVVHSTLCIRCKSKLLHSKYQVNLEQRQEIHIHYYYWVFLGASESIIYNFSVNFFLPFVQNWCVLLE